MKVHITYYGMDGEGRTITEAKKDAGAKIEKALHGYYTPRILRHAGYMALVAREPFSGWGYRLIHADSTATEESIYLSSSREDREDCVKTCFRHMAQLAGHYRGIEKYLTASDQAELDRYYEFQRRYAELRAEGHTDADAHRIACGLSIEQVAP